MSPFVGQQRTVSGAVAVPNVSIPNVASLSQRATGVGKQKATHTDHNTKKNKRAQASTNSASSAMPPSHVCEVVLLSGSPDWIIKAVKLLTRDDFGPSWQRLVDDWLQYEHASNFANKGRLGNKARPPTVADWIQHARSETFCPAVNPSMFGTQFAEWWHHLRSVPGMDSGWAGLTGITGVNGLLSILVALTFWHDGLSSTDTRATGSLDPWLEAVESVCDVLKKLN